MHPSARRHGFWDVPGISHFSPPAPPPLDRPASLPVGPSSSHPLFLASVLHVPPTRRPFPTRAPSVPAALATCSQEEWRQGLGEAGASSLWLPLPLASSLRWVPSLAHRPCLAAASLLSSTWACALRCQPCSAPAVTAECQGQQLPQEPHLPQLWRLGVLDQGLGLPSSLLA